MVKALKHRTPKNNKIKEHGAKFLQDIYLNPVNQPEKFTHQIHSPLTELALNQVVYFLKLA